MQDLAPNVFYTPPVDTFKVGIEKIKPASSIGGPATVWSIVPAPPAGISFNIVNGEFSGTATSVSLAQYYMVIAAGPYGADTAYVNLAVVSPVGIQPSAFTFKVSGDEKPYAFKLPAGIEGTEQVTMRIVDMWGRTVWDKTVRPDATEAALEVTWNGRSSNGRLASAGIYVVRVTVLNEGKAVNYTRKSVTLRPR